MCPGVIYRAEPGERLKHLRHTGIGTISGRGVRTQTIQPKKSLEAGVASARSDEGDSGIEDDDIQKQL